MVGVPLGNPAASQRRGRAARIDAEISLGPHAALSSTACDMRSAGTTGHDTGSSPTSARERLIMSKGQTSKANVRKKGKTLKEKQTAKRVKRDEQNGHSSNIPPTGR